MAGREQFKGSAAELQKAAVWERGVRINIARHMVDCRHELTRMAEQLWGTKHPKYREAKAAEDAAWAEYTAASEESLETIVARLSSGRARQ